MLTIGCAQQVCASREVDVDTEPASAASTTARPVSGNIASFTHVTINATRMPPIMPSAPRGPPAVRRRGAGSETRGRLSVVVPRLAGVPLTDRPWLPVAAVATTLLLWASAFVAIRHLGQDFSAGALSLGRLVVGSLALGAVGRLAGAPAAERARLAGAGRDRRAVVRRLQRRPQPGRAPRRRRHVRDADPDLAGADRGARDAVPRRAVHRWLGARAASSRSPAWC